MHMVAFYLRSEYQSHSLVMKFSIQSFDENGNSIVDGQEIVKFKEEANFSVRKDILSSWTDSQIDGDDNTGTEDELIQFISKVWITSIYRNLTRVYVTQVQHSLTFFDKYS